MTASPEPAGPAETRGATPLLGVAWKVLAALSVFLILVLGVGVALPGTWSAERETRVEADPESVFDWLDSPARWREWNSWPEVRLEPSGPERGEGAAMSWDDPYAGAGTFTVVESRPPRFLSYRVEVQGGSILTVGTLELSAVAGGTRIRWREEGSFGWNPLMGYAALTMPRVQGTELERGLARLRAVVETGSPPDSFVAPRGDGALLRRR